MKYTRLDLIAIPAQAGTHIGHEYRPESILGPVSGRTRGPV